MSNKKNDINKDQIDDLFRDKLENRSFEFKEEYWNDAETMIEEFEKSGALKRKKRRRALFLWSIASIVLVIAALLFLKPSGNEKEIAEATGNEHTETKNSSGNNVDENKNNASDFNSDKKEITIINAEDTLPLKINTTQQLNPEQDNLNGYKDRGIQNSNNAQTSEKTKKNNNASIVHTSENIESDNLSNSKIDENERTDLSKNENSTPNKEKTKSNTSNKENVNVADDNSISENDSNTGKKDNTVENNGNKELITTDPVQTFSDNITLNNTGDSLIKETTLNIADSAGIYLENDPLALDKKIEWFVGAHFGFDYVTKTFRPSGSNTASNFSPNQSYIEQRETQESSILISGLGFTGGIAINKFNISTGFNSYRLGEDVNYSIQSSYIDSLINPNYVFVGADTTYIDSISTIIDTVIYYYDTSYTVSYETTDTLITETETNLLSYFEIPLLFGYVIEKGKWSINLQTGPSISIYRFASGNSITETLDALAPLENSNTFSKTTFNWLFTPSVSYAIKENLELQLQPWLRWNITSAVKDSNYELRYQSYGLHIGLLYHF
ncbi:MAG: hypothetical protein H7Y00_14530 [Fimbriimonadaceae bacterium]|nr:hypothetical protein [Chitinophagales bacterium]